jgi:hypothetical protein
VNKKSQVTQDRLYSEERKREREHQETKEMVARHRETEEWRKATNSLKHHPRLPGRKVKMPPQGKTEGQGNRLVSTGYRIRPHLLQVLRDLV